VDTLIKALDDCLEKIHSGATIDQVLETYPELQEELRSLLETANAAKSLRFEQAIPMSTLVRSRSRFLYQAEKMVNARQNLHWGSSFRSSAVLVYGVIICLVIVLGTGIASGESIPGDIFYPVKLASEQTRLFLENNPVARISLEENYDRKRAQETDNLMQRERLIETTFAGFLTSKERDQWAVAGIQVVFPQNLQSLAEEMRGKYIEVKGHPQSSGIFMVNDIHARQFEITGTIDTIQPDQWIVSQMSLGVTSNTLIMGQPVIGGDAKLTIIRTEDNQLIAISIQALNSNHNDGQSATPQPTHAIRPTIGALSSDDGSDTLHKTPLPSRKENDPAQSLIETQQPTRQNKGVDQGITNVQGNSAPPSDNATPTKENTPSHNESDQGPKPTQQEKDPGHTPQPGAPYDSDH